MTKILLLRFSAMGDVTLLVPVLRSLVAAHENVEVTVVTRPRFSAFFQSINRVAVFEADVDNQYVGFFGLRNLFRVLLASADFNLVIDMHDHVRTMFLRNLFKLAGKTVLVFKKGRTEKKQFVRKENKITKPLLHTTERYKEVFNRAGFDFTLLPAPHLIPSENSNTLLSDWLGKSNLIKNEKWIGIAPFALHKSKIWPLSNYPKMIDALIKKYNPRIFFFGGGEDEIDYFETFTELFPRNCTIVAGNLKMPEEIALMHRLDLMICTDSSNMHLASICGIPILSIWGGTHPDVGFAPYGSSEENILQISRTTLPCRPCSVFGKEECHRGDFACLTTIQIQAVAERIEKLLVG